MQGDPGERERQREAGRGRGTANTRKESHEDKEGRDGVRAGLVLSLSSPFLGPRCTRNRKREDKEDEKRKPERR